MTKTKVLQLGTTMIRWVNANYAASWQIKQELKQILENESNTDELKYREFEEYSIDKNDYWPG